MNKRCNTMCVLCGPVEEQTGPPVVEDEDKLGVCGLGEDGVEPGRNVVGVGMEGEATLRFAASPLPRQVRSKQPPDAAVRTKHLKNLTP